MFMYLKLLHGRRMRERKDTPKQISSSVHTAPLFKEHQEKESYEDKQCRVCLKKIQICIPIFGGHNSEDISEDLATMASIEIDPLDTFPKYLCYSCHTFLQAAVSLRKKAQQSDIALRNTKINKEISTESNQNDNRHSIDSKTEYEVETEVKVVTEAVVETEVDSNKNENSLHCNKCNINFKTITKYNNHLLDKHKTDKSQCPICLKLYKKTYIKQHMELHNGKSYVCDICGKGIAQQGHFVRHRLTHFAHRPFKCKLCPYRGRFPEYLKMHMRSHAPKSDRPYPCSKCPIRCISKSNLTKHIWTKHPPNLDNKCGTCGKGFRKKSDLELHVKADHIGVKDHFCDICGAGFGYRRRLLHHQRKVHKREKLRSGRISLQVETK